jgi:hypothetical protein
MNDTNYAEPTDQDIKRLRNLWQRIKRFLGGGK